MVRFAIFLVLSMAIFACDKVEEHKEKGVGEPFIVKQDSNYFLYSEKFAERFNLISGGVAKLDDGLYAVGFHLRANKNDPSLLDCALKLYIDSDLGVATPSNERGNRGRWSENSEAGFFLGKNIPDKEVDWFYERYITTSANTLRVISKNYGEGSSGGSLSDTGIASYDKEYLKGITYLSSNIMCGTLESSSIPYEVHLKKSTYQGRFGPSTPGYDFENQPESLIRFDIPNRLIYAVLPVIKKDFEEFVKREKTGLNQEVESGSEPSFIIPPRVDFSEEE